MSKLLKNTVIYTIGRLLPQTVGFILLPIYTRYMIPSEYGIVQSMQALVPILAIMFSLAVERSMARLYFDYKTEEDKKALVGNVTLMIFIFTAVFYFLLIAFHSYVSRIYTEIDFYPYFFLAITTSVITAFAQVPQLTLQVQEKAGEFILLSSTQFLLMSGFILYFVVYKQEGAEGMLKGQLVGNLVYLPLVLFYILKLSSFKIRKDIIKNVFTYSIPLIPTFLFAWALGLSNRIFIEHYANLHQVGLYSFGAKIAQVIILMGGAFLSAYSPTFYKIAGDKSYNNSKETLANLNFIFTTIILFLAFSLAFVSKELIQIFFDHKYAEALPILLILILTNSVNMISGLLNFMIYQEKKTVVIMIITFAVSAINVIFNWLIIPKYQMQGAAWVAFATAVLYFIIRYYYAQKFYFVPFKWHQLIPIIFSFIIIQIACSYISTDNIYLDLIIKIIMILIIIFVLFNKFKHQYKTILKV